MSSISVGELKYILSMYPDDYEVIMEITTKYDVEAVSNKHSIYQWYKTR